MAGKVLSVRIVGDARDLEKAFRQASDASDSSSKKLLSFGKAAALGAGAAGVGLLVVGLKKSVEAAQESEKAQARLSQALSGAGISHEKYGKAIDASIQKTSRLAALDDEELSDSFASLARSTGNVQQATEGMNLAADIARSKNISLAAATKGVEKAYLGSATGLKKFGIVIPEVTDAQETTKKSIEALKEAHDGKLTPALKRQAEQMMKNAKALDKAATSQDAIAAAQKKYAGGAEAYGKTAAGAQERFQVALENVQETIGAKLLPVITKMMVALTNAIAWMEDNWPRFQQIIRESYEKIRPIVDGIKAAFGGLVTAIKGNVDIIAGIFTGDWSRVWNGLGGVVRGAFTVVRATFTTEAGLWKIALTKIGELALDGLEAGLKGLGRVVITAMKEGAKKIAELSVDWNVAAAKLAARAIEGLVNGLAGIPGKVASAFSGIPGRLAELGGSLYSAALALGGRIVDGAVDGIRALGPKLLSAVRVSVNWLVGKINAIIGRINSALEFSTPAVKVLGKTVIPAVGYNAPDIPSIPALAGGGIVTGPTLALIGEQGPEAVVPLGSGGGIGGDFYATIVLEVDGAELARVNRKYALRDARGFSRSSVTGSGAYGLS